MPDSTSFDAFYRETRTRVAHFVYAMTGDAAEAQDAAQEAFARAWQRWDQVSGYESPEGWVRTVAWRLAINRWRRARNRLHAHVRHGAESSAPAPSEDNVAIMAALRLLPAEQRMAIVLHHLVGRSVAEIAAETGTPEGTIKARLARGRRALRPMLTPHADEDDRLGEPANRTGGRR
jgi:RNA polymerase sigma-70 factor (ECF subfamily)